MIPYAVKAIKAGVVPIPTKGIKRPSRARLGMVWMILVIWKTTSPALLLWARSIPKGMAIKQESKRASMDKSKCSPKACQICPWCDDIVLINSLIS